jgi:hypothetical protein
MNISQILEVLVKDENVVYFYLLIGFMWLTFLATFIGIVGLLYVFINARVKEAQKKEGRIIDHNIGLGVPMSIESSKGRVKITAVPAAFSRPPQNLGSSGLNDENSKN